MGASVGIGALIVGTSLLTIFALASAAIDLQVDEALERIEETGDNSVPSFTVNDASNDVNAVAGVSFTSGTGSGYAVGDIISSGSVVSLSFVSGGTGYSDSTNLVWSGGGCSPNPTGTYTVSTEAFEYTATATSHSMNNDYFTYSSSTTDYYVWFNVNGNGVEPILGGTGIEVSLTNGDSDIVTAGKIADRIDTLGSAVDSGAGATRTITLDAAGAATNVATGTSGFTVSMTDDGGVMLTAALATGGNGCTGTPTVDGDGGSSSSLTLVMHSSFGFSAKVKTIDGGGGITAVEMVSAGQGHTSTPNIFAAETTGSGASITAVLDNVLTWNMTNNGQEVLEFTHIWFALDGGDPEQLSTSTYTIWDFPKHDYLFPGETVMVSYDLNSATPSVIAASCMGGQSSKAVTQNG